VKGKGRTNGHRPLNLHAPPGDEAKPISCPTCKELLKSEFLQDDEDWVWKNAIKKDGQVSLHIPYTSLLIANATLR
jgi:pre-mRNA cleavage complex 2 protein Pcf11